MKLRFKELFALLLVCCVSFVAIAGCSSDNDSNSAEAETIIVSASIFPIADLIRQIADDKVQVNLILEPGDSPHTYNPTIKEQEKINQACQSLKICQANFHSGSSYSFHFIRYIL